MTEPEPLTRFKEMLSSTIIRKRKAGIIKMVGEVLTIRNDARRNSPPARPHSQWLAIAVFAVFVLALLFGML